MRIADQLEDCSRRRELARQVGPAGTTLQNMISMRVLDLLEEAEAAARWLGGDAPAQLQAAWREPGDVLCNIARWLRERF